MRITRAKASREPGNGRAPGMLSMLSGGAWGAGRQRTERPSGRLKELLSQVVGERYDRSPCPHALTAWDTVPDPQRPDDVHRRRTRRTLVPCERPADHVRGRTEAEQLHSGAGDRTW